MQHPLVEDFLCKLIRSLFLLCVSSGPFCYQNLFCQGGHGHGHSHFPVERYASSNGDLEDGVMDKLQNGEAGGVSLPRAEGDVRGVGEDDKMLSTGQTVQVGDKTNLSLLQLLKLYFPVVLQIAHTKINK